MPSTTKRWRSAFATVSKYVIDEDSIDKFLSQSSTGNSENLGVHLAVLKKLPMVIDGCVDVEIHPDYIKKDKVRKPENGIGNKNLLIHRMYGAIEMDGETRLVKITMQERRDDNGHAYDYRVTKIGLSISGSSTTDALDKPNESDKATNGLYPLTKLLKNLEKSYDPGKFLLSESAKLDEQNNNGEGQDKVISRDLADTDETPVRWVRPGEWKKKVYALDDVKLRIRKVNEQMMSADSKEERDRLFDERSRLIGERQRIEKELDSIRPLRSDRQARESAERQWRRAHERGAELVEKLGLGDTVTMVDCIDELKGSERFGPRRRMAKGWYDPKMGKIVVVMGNHKGPQDVVQTILHEGGIEVSLDDAEGQRVLDEDREHQARMMGSKTNRKKTKIAEELQ